MAIVGHIALRGNDPMLPTNILELDMEPPTFADTAERKWQLKGAPLPSGRFAFLPIQSHHQQGDVQILGNSAASWVKLLVVPHRGAAYLQECPLIAVLVSPCSGDMSEVEVKGATQ